MQSPAIPRRSLLAGVGLVALAGTAEAGLFKPSDDPEEHQGGHGHLGRVTCGDGPEPVLVLHEWLGDHRNFALALPYFDTKRFRFVLADLRGYGLSRNLAGQYTIEEAAADALELMSHYDYQRFTLVGHSMSGMLAQYLTLHAPERVNRTVLISPVPPSGFHADEAALAKLRAVVTDDDAARAATDGRTGHRYGPQWIDRKLAIIRDAAPEAMLGYLTMFTTTDFAAEVKGLKAPIAVIAGEQDIPVYRPDAIQKAFSAWYPNLTVAGLRDSGHYSMLEEPGLFATALNKALAGA